MMNTSAHHTSPAPARPPCPELLAPEDLRVIGKALRTRPEEITGVSALKKGMTNRSFLFSCRGEPYIIRVPGVGTGRLISRRQEAEVYRVVRGRNICEDVLYIDPDSGYKISRFLPGARTCDPLNQADTARCMEKLREFHRLGLRVNHEFDLFAHISFYESLWEGVPSAYPDYRETKDGVFRLRPFLDAHAGEKTLTHIDAVPDNFLFSPDGRGGEELRLIDWEYAAMHDPHVDVAMFCIYAMYNRDQADRLISQYFTGGCPSLTRIKIYGYIAACGLLWSNWCEYKRSLGVEFGDYAREQYRYARDYCGVVRRELERLGEVLP